jgi:hypothetical protein
VIQFVDPVTGQPQVTGRYLAKARGAMRWRAPRRSI